MPGAVNEIIAEAGLLNMAPGGAIDFPARDAATRVDRVQNRLHPCIARVAHNFEHLTHPTGRRASYKTHPGDVVVDRARGVLLAPNVQQNQIALADRHRAAGLRLIMRIAGIGIDRHNRRIIRQNIFAAECFHEPLLNFMLFRAAIAHALADLFKRFGNNRIDAVARRKMRLDLLFAPCRLELCHQVRGTDNVFSQAAQQIDRARIHQRNRKNTVIRGVLHRQVALVGEHRL